MNRRDALVLTAATLAVPSLLSSTAFAKMGDAETEHAAQTLAAGSVALETSKAAQEKAENAWVKKFASYEVAEQSTIAEILKSMGAVPAKLTEKQTAAVAKAKEAKAGGSFDREYVATQIEGHNELLRIQETYIGKGKDQATVGLAKLARSQIKEHLDLLATIQKDLKS
jgi:putative membrane protein